MLLFKHLKKLKITPWRISHLIGENPNEKKSASSHWKKRLKGETSINNVQKEKLEKVLIELGIENAMDWTEGVRWRVK